METVTLSVDGMHCGSCVARLTKALSDVPGVTPEEVRVGSARVGIDPARVSRGDLVRAITDAGYAVKEAPASGCCSGRGCCAR